MGTRVTDLKAFLDAHPQDGIDMHDGAFIHIVLPDGRRFLPAKFDVDDGELIIHAGEPVHGCEEPLDAWGGIWREIKSFIDRPSAFRHPMADRVLTAAGRWLVRWSSSTPMNASRGWVIYSRGAGESVFTFLYSTGPESLKWDDRAVADHFNAICRTLPPVKLVRS